MGHNSSQRNSRSSQRITRSHMWRQAKSCHSPMAMASRTLIKNALKKEKDPAKALASYKATPLENGYSPAQMLFGRKTRTAVPVFPDQLKPSWPGLQELREHEQESKIVQTKRYNVTHRCTELTAPKPGGRLWIRKKTAVVAERSTTPRSYMKWYMRCVIYELRIWN